MKIPFEQLKYYNNYLTYSHGYRIVYFYENHYEIPNSLYAKEIKDFIIFFEDIDKNTFISEKDIIDIFLKRNPEALAAAIYSIDGTCIFKKNKHNIKNIKNYNIFKEELIYDYSSREEISGYRLVYFYDDYYSIGEFCKTIEGFMLGFSIQDPIKYENDVPKFISNDDLLNRCLNLLPDIIKVAIYKTDGTCISIKERNNSKSKK